MIRKADTKDVVTVAELACQLWSEHTLEDMCEEMSQMIAKQDAALFVAFAEDVPIGFAQCQLRNDYVEGTESSPVGYLEGIYVVENYRKHGIAKQLLDACESWAAEMGCSEFASDCELTNTQSLLFHINMGFEEANRIICFTKRI